MTYILFCYLLLLIIIVFCKYLWHLHLSHKKKLDIPVSTHWAYIGLIALFLISSLLIATNREISEIGVGDVLIRTKEPPSLIPGKEKEITVTNKNEKNNAQFIITDSSPEVIQLIQFSKGGRFVKPLGKSPDGKKFYYGLDLPPGEEATATSPNLVTLDPVPINEIERKFEEMVKGWADKGIGNGIDNVE